MFELDKTVRLPKTPDQQREIYELIGVLYLNQARWDQGTWCSGEVNPETLDYHECGTTACGAGFKALHDGMRPHYYLDDVYRDGVSVRLPVASGLFYNPEEGNNITAPSFSADSYASQRFGMDEEEANYVFHWLPSRHDDMAMREMAFRLDRVARGLQLVSQDLYDRERAAVQSGRSTDSLALMSETGQEY